MAIYLTRGASKGEPRWDVWQVNPKQGSIELQGERWNVRQIAEKLGSVQRLVGLHRNETTGRVRSVNRWFAYDLYGNQIGPDRRTRAEAITHLTEEVNP